MNEDFRKRFADQAVGGLVSVGLFLALMAGALFYTHLQVRGRTTAKTAYGDIKTTYSETSHSESKYGSRYTTKAMLVVRFEVNGREYTARGESNKAERQKTAEGIRVTYLPDDPRKAWIGSFPSWRIYVPVVVALFCVGGCVAGVVSYAKNKKRLAAYLRTRETKEIVRKVDELQR